MAAVECGAVFCGMAKLPLIWHERTTSAFFKSRVGFGSHAAYQAGKKKSTSKPSLRIKGL